MGSCCSPQKKVSAILTGFEDLEIAIEDNDI